MVFESVFVAYIARMDDERGTLVAGVIADLIRPIVLVDGVEYLGIRDMHEGVAPILMDAPSPFL